MSAPEDISAAHAVESMSFQGEARLSSDQWERNFFKVVCSFLLCPLATKLATGPPWLCGVVPVVTAAKVCADCWPDHLLLYSQLVAWSRFWARIAVHSKQLWRGKDKKWASQASTCTIKYLACHRFIIGVQQKWNIKLHVDFQFFFGFLSGCGVAKLW